MGTRQGGSNEFPQSMFLSRNKKINIHTPVNPSFTVKKVGFRGSNYIGVFRDVSLLLTMDMSKFNDGKVSFINSGWSGLR